MSPLFPQLLSHTIAPPDDRIILSALLQISGLVVIVIAWHRYVLLSDSETGTPPLFRTAAFINYVIAALKLAFVLLPAILVFAFLFTLLLYVLPTALHTPLTWAISDLAAPVFVGWLILRLGLILPAAALDRSFGLRASWVATSPLSAPLFYLAAILALFTIVIELLGALLLSLPLAPAAIVGSFIIYAQVLLSASVLSTLYGALVQGRAL